VLLKSCRKDYRSIPDRFECMDCQLANLKRKPFESMDKWYKKLEVIVSDICGPIKPPSLGNNSYILPLMTFVPGLLW
jgi:hypothetical protein